MSDTDKPQSEPAPEPPPPPPPPNDVEDPDSIVTESEPLPTDLERRVSSK